MCTWYAVQLCTYFRLDDSQLNYGWGSKFDRYSSWLISSRDVMATDIQCFTISNTWLNESLGSAKQYIILDQSCWPNGLTSDREAPGSIPTGSRFFCTVTRGTGYSWPGMRAKYSIHCRPHNIGWKCPFVLRRKTKIPVPLYNGISILFSDINHVGIREQASESPKQR